jgi:hypothetical protein
LFSCCKGKESYCHQLQRERKDGVSCKICIIDYSVSVDCLGDRGIGEKRWRRRGRKGEESKKR